MITELLKCIKKFFLGEDIENYKKSQSSSIKHKQKNVIQNFEKKSTSKKKRKKIHPYYTPSFIEKTRKDVLSNKIKANILFLDGLLDSLSTDIKYKSYYKKVSEMKNQSESCFRILHRADEFASYYPGTAIMILRHTDSISSLLEIK